jgi:hypothetical protein
MEEKFQDKAQWKKTEWGPQVCRIFYTHFFEFGHDTYKGQILKVLLKSSWSGSVYIASDVLELATSWR